MRIAERRGRRAPAPLEAVAVAGRSIVASVALMAVSYAAVCASALRISS